MKLIIKVNRTDSNKLELITLRDSINGQRTIKDLVLIIGRDIFWGTQLDNDIDDALADREEVEIEIKVVK